MKRGWRLLFVLIISSNISAVREYEKNERTCVQELYYQNHMHQTVQFVQAQHRKYLSLNHGIMSVWEALERSNEIVDDSDPDLDLTQINHAFQTAQAIRADGHPRWLILTGLIHDLGKVLYLFGEPQWAVVGDTFPVGCAYANSIVYLEFFKENADYHDPNYQTKYGIYKPQCGLDTVLMSWGHDEYLYHVVKEYVPAQAGYVIRYHSFYAEHKAGSYAHLLNEYDLQMMEWVKLFNQYDLYSKSRELPDIKKLTPYYKELVTEFFPQKINW